MSICSTRSSNETSRRAAVRSNGYRLTTTTSIERDAVGLRGGEIVGAIAPGENAAVDGRMERLDASVHHLGEAGDRGDVRHREARLAQRARGTAGGNELEAAGGEAAAQIDDAGLVGNA